MMNVRLGHMRMKVSPVRAGNVVMNAASQLRPRLHRDAHDGPVDDEVQCVSHEVTPPGRTRLTFPLHRAPRVSRPGKRPKATTAAAVPVVVIAKLAKSEPA